MAPTVKTRDEKKLMVTMEDARTVSAALAERVFPVAVIVFGSVAESGRGNDLDLLVVTGEDGSGERVQAALREFYGRFAVDTFIASVDALTREFMNGSVFLRLVQRQGKLLYMKEPLRRWIELAIEDLRQAEYLLEGGFYRGACFHAQQSVEKALKAELLRKGWELERIHNFRRLPAICAEYRIELGWEDGEVDFLDSIYRGRYPAEEGLLPLNPPGPEDGRQALATAARILGQLGMTESTIRNDNRQATKGES